MPGLSRWMVRVSLVSLVIGALLGGLLLLVKAGVADARLWSLIPAHADALIGGWMLHFVQGVAHWILPRRGALGRGPRAPVVAAVILLEAGLLLAVGGPLVTYALGWPYPIAVFAAGIALQAASVGAFVAHVLPRVRAVIAIDNARMFP